MRTTVSLPDPLLAAAKQRARERDTSLSAIIVDALRVALSRPAKRSSKHFTLVTFRGDGTLPGVDLSRTSELYALDDRDMLRVSDVPRTQAPPHNKRRR
jgi:hypothetical protein